ncbi:tRNA lysidine(34) synthetase TilS [bacterium]|nr:tRNA lysidine(34) synthetase TilS [bacterium]
MGLSGGPDSIFLFTQLLLFKKNNNIDIIIAHVNYNLRGKDSIADMDFVKELCKKYEFECEILDTKQILNAKKGNTEDLARNIRYDLFKKLSKKYNTPNIFIGHTLNDLFETFFLKMFNNSDPTSMYNMYYENEIDGLKIIRPLLNTDKKDILLYLEKNNIPFRIDKTNETNSLKRNFIRNKVVPDLEGKFTNFLKHFHEIYEKERFIHNKFKNDLIDVFKDISTREKDIYRFPIDGKFSPYEYFSIIKIALKEIGFSKTAVKAEHFKIFKDFFYKNGGKYLNFSGKYYIFKGYEHIYVYNEKSLKDYEYNLVISKKGSYRVEIPFMDFEFNIKEDDEFIIRPVRHGDFVMRNGRKRPVSYYLKKFKIDHLLRKIFPIVEKNGKIVMLGNIKVFDENILHILEVK